MVTCWRTAPAISCNFWSVATNSLCKSELAFSASSRALPISSSLPASSETNWLNFLTAARYRSISRLKVPSPNATATTYYGPPEAASSFSLRPGRMVRKIGWRRAGICNVEMGTTIAECGSYKSWKSSAGRNIGLNWSGFPCPPHSGDKPASSGVPVHDAPAHHRGRGQAAGERNNTEPCGNPLASRTHVWHDAAPLPSNTLRRECAQGLVVPRLSQRGGETLRGHPRAHAWPCVSDLRQGLLTSNR